MSTIEEDCLFDGVHGGTNVCQSLDVGMADDVANYPTRFKEISSRC